MSDRHLEVEQGVCDSCGKRTAVWDAMGDLYCWDCLQGGAEGEDHAPEGEGTSETP
jgi:predicted amidophosphoribosyltransferase